MDQLFGTIFFEGMNAGSFFICLFVAIATGLALAWLSILHTKASKSFFVTLTILPAAVAMVIALVNGNVGAGIAVAGAFSLTRFRSAPGTAKEIALIFVATAAGLAFGMGYLAYGVCFTIIAALVLLVLGKVHIWEPKVDPKEKTLKITIPETLDYSEVFNEIFAEYTTKAELTSVKTTHMGALFRLSYHVVLKDETKEKAFLDALRIRNGNLEISCSRVRSEEDDL